jgi:hypothetical protein
MVYTGLFNKLCLSFIPSREPYKNLSHGLNALVSPQMRDSNGVKFKSFTDPRPGSEDKSIVETYSICQSTNGTDELAAAEFFSFGMYDEKGNKRKTDIFSYQCKALGIKNQHLVEKLYNTLPTIWDFRLSNIHTKLIQLTFINDINYNLIPVLNYEQFLAAVCLTQVKLFEMGFEHLAVLSCAIRNPENPTYFLDDSFKLTTKEREELISLCDVYIGQSISTTENIIVKSTTDFIDELCSSGWDSNIEVGLLGNEKYVNAMSIGQMYQIDLVPEIKKELLELIKIANITEENE